MDNAATTCVKDEVLAEMLPYFTEKYGNAASVYRFAAQSTVAVDEARRTVAEFIGAKPKEIYFTGGGSESDNWALISVAEQYEKKGKHIITSKIEHHAILHTCEYLEKRGFEVTYLDVDEDGVISLFFIVSLCISHSRFAFWRPVDRLQSLIYQSLHSHLGE